MRHSALIVIKDLLYVFYSQVGDIPERIYLSTIEINNPINKWKVSNPIEIIRPEYEWEGGNLPLEKSSRSAINIPVNQLRDPAIYKENDTLYLLYSIKGENGIGICTLEIK
jgi:GH43 family beta-xylosidase